MLFRSIRVCGLMTMAPIPEKPGDSISVFERTKRIFDDLSAEMGEGERESWQILSMGMSQDFEDAILCGATHIRVGTAIFGRRLSY